MVRSLALLVSLLACLPLSAGASELVVTLVATAEVKGTPEPCGCASDPLGDVARVATLARDGLWLDAGGLLFDPDRMSAAKKPQALATARALADIYRRARVGIGPDDLALGAGRVAPPRQAANVSGVTRAAPEVVTIKGVRVGVFGVASPGILTHVKASDPVAAARAAVAALTRQHAQVVVALLGMRRVEARRLMTEVQGISFGIVGVEVGEGMVQAEPVNGGFLVAPADLARRVARIDLHVRDGKVALTPFAGAAARAAARLRVRHRMALLRTQLAAWKRDPHADPTFVHARQAELDGLATQDARLATAHPTPPATSYVTYALEPVNSAIARDRQVAARLRELDREIGRQNLRAARGTPRPPAEAGQPTYVGMAACQKCHAPAVAFWKHTVHASAWKTLVERDKQFNYECIGCHVTGWQKPGGVTLNTVEKAGLVNVQCEVCHGPGSKHVAQAGLEDAPSMVRRPADDFCASNCHTKEHSDTFQLIPYLRDVTGPGHGAKLRAKLGPGPTAHELRKQALAAAGR